MLRRACRLAGFVLLLVGLVHCGGGQPETPIPWPAVEVPEALQPVPELDLSGAEPAASEQLTGRRAALDALAADPAAPPAELAAAYGELGLLYLTYEFLDAAAVCFDDARLLEPDSFRWTYLAGYLAMIRGRLDEAAGLLGAALEIEPDYLPATLRLGRIRLDQGDYPAARALFERALELDPAAAAAHEGLGKAAAGSGDPRGAAGHFRRALELAPGASGIRYALGQAYRDLGELDRARTELAKAGDVPARIDDPLINPLAEVAASSQFFMVQGAEALDDGDFASAAASYRTALDRDSQSWLAHRGLAFALQKMGDVDGAVAALEETLAGAAAGDGEEARAHRAETLALLGDLEAGRGNDGRAVERFGQSLAAAPDRPAVALRLGNALARRGRFAEAVAAYDRALGELPEAVAPVVLEKRATALVNLGRGSEALADFRRAIAVAPDDPRLRLRYAEALDFLGRPDAAAAERATAERLADAAGEAGGRGRLAAAAARMAAAEGDSETAVARYREALAADPGDLASRSGLAAALGRLGRWDQAAAEYARVVEAAPGDAAAHRGLIAALVLGGRYGPARVALSEALRRLPRDAGLALTQVRLLATAPDAAVRDGALALDVARRVAADRDEPLVRESLALALAEAGHPAEAAEVQRPLVADAERAADPALAALRRARLEAFERGRGWVARTPEEIVVPLD